MVIPLQARAIQLGKIGSLVFPIFYSFDCFYRNAGIRVACGLIKLMSDESTTSTTAMTMPVNTTAMTMPVNTTAMTMPAATTTKSMGLNIQSAMLNVFITVMLTFIIIF